MAFDALRLRNVIQLLGILGQSASCLRSNFGRLLNKHGTTGFHLALIVFAGIQIHETKAAVVRGTGPAKEGGRPVSGLLCITGVLSDDS